MLRLDMALEVDKVYDLDKRAGFHMLCGGGWAKLCEILDPDLHNPLLFVAILAPEAWGQD